MTDHSYTFICTECRQRVCAIMGKEHVPFDLCATCISAPGWFENAELRALFTHDPVAPGEKA